MDITLTEEEQSKYDDVYSKITSNYSKEDMIELENDELAKYFLKHIILKYIFTGSFPEDLNIGITKTSNVATETYYDAKIPLQTNTKPLVENVEIISNNTIEDTNEFIDTIQD